MKIGPPGSNSGRIEVIQCRHQRRRKMDTERYGLWITAGQDTGLVRDDEGRIIGFAWCLAYRQGAEESMGQARKAC